MTVLKLEVFVLKLEFAKIKEANTNFSETALLSVYVVRLCHISPYLRNQTKPLLPL